MSAGPNSDDLAAKAAEAVRRIVAEAEEKAAGIIREAEAKAVSLRETAEADATRVRERAESDARGQIEAAKRALDELGGTLVAAASSALPKSETEPKPTETEEEPEPGPDPDPEPEPESPTESPSAPEAPVSPPPGNGDDAAERLVAMKLAMEGKDSAEIEAELAQKFGARNRSELLKDVLSRVPR